MLPPDNFQEDPKPVVAHRTSPTNIGLYLLSTVARPRFRLDRHARGRRAARSDAGDHGQAASASAGTSTTGTTRSDLRPLEPRYVSSVDSGNLAGHLIALANACAAWRDTPRRRMRDVCAGIDDSLRARPRGAARTCPTTGARSCVSLRRARQALDALADCQAGEPLATPGCDELAAQAATVADLARTLGQRTRTTTPAPTCCSGSRPRSGRSRATAATCAQTRRHDCARSAGSQATRARRRAPWRTAMEFGFLLDPRAPAAVDRLSRRRGQARSELLRPAGVRGAARQLRRHRQGRRAGPALVPARPRGDAGRHGAALISWSGSMFEYLMPSLVMRAPRGSLLEQTNRWSCGGRSTMAPSSACRGASRSRPTTRATSSSPINIRTSACRAWA